MDSKIELNKDYRDQLTGFTGRCIRREQGLKGLRVATLAPVDQHNIYSWADSFSVSEDRLVAA